MSMRSRGRVIAGWVLTVLLAVLFMVSAGFKLSVAAQWSRGCS